MPIPFHRLVHATIPLALLPMALVVLTGCGGAATDTAATASDAGGGRGEVALGSVEPTVIDTGDGNRLTAPAEAIYTIYCRDFTGTNHVASAQRARDFAQAAMPRGGGTGFYVVHGDNRSILYHGFYKTFDPEVDRRVAARAERDRETINAMTMRGPEGQVVKAFPRAVFQPLDRPDPKAPPQWNLANADGYWTVVIAVYTDPALRKQAAIESVIEARKLGVEAYYLHDTSYSYVCIGAWPKSAVTRRTLNTDGMPNVDPNNPRPLLLMSRHLPDAIKKALQRGAQNAGAVAVAMEDEIEVHDPELLETLKRYPYSVDGYEDKDVPLLVEIHKATGNEPVDTDPLDTVPSNDAMDRLLTGPRL